MTQKSRFLFQGAAIVIWMGLILQYVLLLQNSTVSLLETHLRFFSYFTIDSNILIALSTTAVGFFPESRWGRFFDKPATITALTIYILVVFIIYNVILRPLFPMAGWDKVANELLHVLNPLLFFAIWIFTPKGHLKWASIPYWLIYPLAYCMVIIFRGAQSNFYPYPFMNVTKLGMQQVLLNSLGVTAVFLFLSLFFVGLSKSLAKRN